MSQYLLRRLILMVPTLLGVAVLVFVLMRLIPGDIVSLRLMGEGGVVSQEALDAERARLGLDRPQLQQLAEWLSGLARLDFGVSMWTGRAISFEIGIRFQLSLQIALMATLLATLLAVPLGTLAAVKQNTWIDYGVRLFAIAGVPALGEWYARVLGVPKAAARARVFFDEAKTDTTWPERFDLQTRYAGFARALLSMSRTDALRSYADAYAGCADKETLLIWGDADHEIPRHHIETIRNGARRLTYIELKGIGHGPNLQATERVNQELLTFLKRKSAEPERPDQ